jgi:hypothetical protein
VIEFALGIAGFLLLLVVLGLLADSVDRRDARRRSHGR